MDSGADLLETQNRNTFKREVDPDSQVTTEHVRLILPLTKGLIRDPLRFRDFSWVS